MAGHQRSTSLFRSIPAAVWAVALAAALLQMAPYWMLQRATPPGWTFTGARSASPDTMQYRVWMRQGPQEGMFVSNRFTSEPNKPHLPVPLYYATGTIATLTNTPPEWVFAAAGTVFAFLLTVVVFVAVRTFFGSMYQVWWVFGVLMLGGGLGAHLTFLSEMRWARQIAIVKRTLIDALQWPTFEDYHAHYIFITLFNSHFSLIWLFAMLAILMLYATIRSISTLRLAVTALLFAISTLLHVYEGITLVAIAASVALVCWRARVAVRSAVVTLAVTTMTVVVMLAWFAFNYRNSGLPLPDWRAVNILFATLVISYPVAWGVIAWGIGDYLKNLDLNRCFLLGWALGCTAVTLSGPFYPYPDRGTMTLQVPLYLIAGGMYFARYPRVTLPAALAIVVLLGATPVWQIRNLLRATKFATDAPHMFINADHRRMIDELAQRATERDILLIDKTDEAWLSDDLWLIPEYPGIQYCGHFFLTVDYDRKRREVTDFYHALPISEQRQFLASHKIRFVFVGPDLDRRRFDAIPGLTTVASSAVGVLYEFVDRTEEGTGQ